jgi:hypothetical protein
VIDAGVFEFDPRVQAAACAYVYCPSNIVVSAAAGQDGVPVEYPAPIASPGATVICSPPSGTVFHPGTNIVHCSAVIGTTNVDTCTFTVAVLSPPPNDEFENATVISSLPYEDTIDTSVATRSDSDSNCSSGATVWYKIKSKKNQEIIASTEGSGYYASVSVFTPSGKELKSIGCDYFVSTRFKALAGHTYYIMIGAANGSDKGRLHFTAVSQPVLKVQAGIAPTAFVSEGAVWYHGTITVSRPTIVDLFATVWISVGPYNIMVDTFSYSAECDGKSTGWTFARYPAPTLPNPLVWVVLTYRAADELAPPPGRAERTIKILSSSPR